MDKREKCSYFERLIKKNGQCDSLFIEQYLNGSGNELEHKFWSEKSSSRLCFDLYSWLCLDCRIKNFQFEKKLPGVLWKKNLSAAPPNMDVYFEIDDKVVFIESKYTEKASWKYIKKEDIDSNGNYPLSEAYWGDSFYKSSKLTPPERFYGYEKIANRFREFCRSIQDSIDGDRAHASELQWFDPKQETCHLFGIIFYILFGCKDNKFNDKTIILSNNVWKCIDSNDNFDVENTIVQVFKEKSEEMLNEIFRAYNCKFIFEHNSIQDDVLNGKFLNLDFESAHLFGLDEKISVKDYILQKYRCTKRG